MLNNNLVRWYNQNKERIWRVIIIVAFVIIIIRLANYFAGENLKKQNENARVNKTTNTETTKIQTNSILTNTVVGKEMAEKSNDIIDEFVKYCNNGEMEKAYSLISDDCKEALYKSEEQFKTEYYNIIFNGNKLYTKENLYSNGNSVTYRVNFTNNLLADGGLKSGESFDDYITIVKKENDEYKLNIGQFIDKKEINKEYEDDNIKIEVIYKNIFREYEIYNIKFTNKTENESIIYDEESNWYVIDNNGKNYEASMNEIPYSWLKLIPQVPQSLNVKFIKTYNVDKYIQKLTLKNIKINDKYIDVEIEL